MSLYAWDAEIQPYFDVAQLEPERSPEVWASALQIVLTHSHDVEFVATGTDRPVETVRLKNYAKTFAKCKHCRPAYNYEPDDPGNF